jgi:ElaB/YqjD/DUF883 family membrane-anchored ribosome-binding protein
MDEFEAIKRQMEARRSSLAEKLEELECRVADTVQGVTSAVSNVKEVVQDTVETVKDSVQDTVGAVQESVDLSVQMQNHPWIVLGGAFALGYFIGKALPDLPTSSSEAVQPATRPMGHDGANGGTRVAWPANPAADQPRRTSWLHELGQSLAPEIDKFKGLALGAALGLVRDYVRQAVPPDLGTKLAGMIDSATSKLGGEPVRDNLANPARGYQYADPRYADAR